MTLSSTLLRTLPQNPTASPAGPNRALPPLDRTEPRVREGGSENGFAQKGRERMKLCTEGLGFESSDDADDVMEFETGEQKLERGEAKERRSGGKRDVIGEGGVFPPPISCIGQSGKPCVRFEKYREGGRVVLRETWVPRHEVLRARREGGVLRLSFVQMDEENFEEYGSEPVTTGPEIVETKRVR